jgi:phage recombination protein Bet
MSTALATQQGGALAISDQELMGVLESSLYPGASPDSIKMVIGYCKAANLDVMQKPVHIVPIWDSKAGRMRDVIMPGVGLYRTQAARSESYAGVSEPEFGPDITENVGGVTITYPAWCKVTVRRAMKNGNVAEFTATERWKENYASRGGKEKSIAPNAMWTKRPYGQISKCAEAQALRKAFPEVGSAPTADEMEGKQFSDETISAEVVREVVREEPKQIPVYDSHQFDVNFPKWQDLIKSGKKTADQIVAIVSSKATLTEAQIEAIRDCEVEEAEVDPFVAALEAAEGE